MAIGLGTIAIGFLGFGLLGFGTLVTASTMSPTGSLAARSAPSVRVEAAAADIAVVDGSTLRLAQRVVRLFGIETPERGQACGSSGSRPGSGASSGPNSDCAAAATAALAALVRDHKVACDVRDSDSLGRPLAICDAGGTELNHALVAGGWARAVSVRAWGRTEDLHKAELLARAERRGLWARVGGASENGLTATW